MKERVIPKHFLPCFACTASSCKNIKHLVRNSSLEFRVFHSQFCAFEAHCKTKKPYMKCWRDQTTACNIRLVIFRDTMLEMLCRGRRRIENSSSYSAPTKMKNVCRKVQIFILQSTDFISQSTDFRFAKYRFHFAKYRFSFRKVQISFRKVQIFISQSTDSHFAKYRFSFRKVQI